MLLERRAELSEEVIAMRQRLARWLALGLLGVALAAGVVAQPATRVAPAPLLASDPGNGSGGGG